MNAAIISRPVINIIIALPQFKINDIYRNYFLNFSVSRAFGQKFGNSLRNSVKYSQKIIYRIRVLNLDNYQFILRVFDQNIYAVIFIFLIFLQTFGIYNLYNLNIFSDKFTQKTFQNNKIRSLLQQSFYRPIKSYVLLLSHFIQFKMQKTLHLPKSGTKSESSAAIYHTSSRITVLTLSKFCKLFTAKVS